MISVSNRVLGFSVARRLTRRLLVTGYWLVILVFTCAFLLNLARHHSAGVFAILTALQILTNLPAFLGGVRAGGMVKPYRGVCWAPLLDRDDLQTVFGPAKPVVAGQLSPEAELDEREARLRDRTHFVAYTLMRWVTLALFATYGLVALLKPGWTQQAGMVFFFLLSLVLWSLPQSLILWNEPDLEDVR